MPAGREFNAQFWGKHPPSLQPAPGCSPSPWPPPPKNALPPDSAGCHPRPPVLLLLLQEATVVPVLMQGMQALCKERPDNPVEFLAYFLLSHNEQSKPEGAKRPREPAPAAPAAADAPPAAS